MGELGASGAKSQESIVEASALGQTIFEGKIGAKGWKFYFSLQNLENTAWHFIGFVSIGYANQLHLCAAVTIIGS